MMSGYFLRLICLCAASFLLVHAVAAFVVWLAAPAVLRHSAAEHTRKSTRRLFALRTAPGAAALLVTAALCLPSYIGYEPASASERIGVGCAAAALLGLMLLLGSFCRAARLLKKSARYRRSLSLSQADDALPSSLSGIAADIVETEQPLLALVGIFRPRILLSRRLLRSLSAAELEAALSHESAHQFSGDNFKRLLLQLAPSAFPFSRRLSSLERAWTRFSEWTADDFASRGEPERRLALASALVHVARMGAAPRLAPLHSSLVAPGEDLSARVNRLLRAQSPRELQTSGRKWLAPCATALVFSGAVLIWLHPSAFQAIHSLLEILLH